VVELLEPFGKYGIPGLVIGVQFFWIWRQEKRFQDLSQAYMNEANARVQDAKGFTKLALDLQEKVIKAVAVIERMFDQSNGAED